MHSKDTMHSKQITAALALLAVPALSFGQAQEAPKTTPKARTGQVDTQEQKAPHFATVSKVIGMDVLARATANGERKDVADVRDFVVDGATGAVTQVILSSGGVGSVGDTLRMRPFGDLRFDRTDPKAPKIWLDVTEADFDASAKLTKEALDAYGCKAIAAAHGSNATRLREAGAKTQPKDGKSADGHMSLLMLASELDDFDVRTAVGSVGEDSDSMVGESLGSVDEAWIDCSAGKISFLTLQHNKRSVVLPMGALVVNTDTDKKTLFCETACTVEQLAAAPAIDEKANLTLDNADFRKSVTEYFARIKPTPVGESSVSRNGRE
jgi:sporulation protein YlmC with PRC-barrel domain